MLLRQAMAVVLDALLTQQLPPANNCLWTDRMQLLLVRMVCPLSLQLFCAAAVPGAAGAALQLVFAVVSPGAVVPNLVAGAIAEAGAQQAGDLMQASDE